MSMYSCIIDNNAYLNFNEANLPRQLARVTSARYTGKQGRFIQRARPGPAQPGPGEMTELWGVVKLMWGSVWAWDGASKSRFRGRIWFAARISSAARPNEASWRDCTRQVHCKCLWRRIEGGPGGSNNETLLLLLLLTAAAAAVAMSAQWQVCLTLGTSPVSCHHTLHPNADMADLYWYDNALRLHSPSTLAVFLRFSDE